MKKLTINWFLALAAGVLLALMINYNSLMAKHSTPLFAAWITHGIGALTSFFLITISVKIFRKEKVQQPVKAPLWAYAGGIPGALTVVLASVTVNSSLGLSGSLALMLVGQILFGLASDIFGLFGHRKRPLQLIDLFIVLLIMTGSGLIILFRT